MPNFHGGLKILNRNTGTSLKLAVLKVKMKRTATMDSENSKRSVAAK